MSDTLEQRVKLWLVMNAGTAYSGVRRISKAHLRIIVTEAIRTELRKAAETVKAIEALRGESCSKLAAAIREQAQ